jgi:formyltetrahydrofolate-dependent phosphoribosylglycinamide formyltransferase
VHEITGISIGVDKVNVAVLGSTRGTDLQGIIDATQNDSLKGIDIKFVLSEKEDAFILERARKHNLRAIFLDPKGKKREEFDAEVDSLLGENDVELVLLIGYMKLMSKDFVASWGNKTMNIHPSLLPMFAGGMDLNVHEAVLERGCKISGCTLMFIDEGADTGPIIMQKVVEIENNETPDSLKAKVQKAEVEAFLEALPLYRDGKIILENDKVKILK